jgi:hypothetical protein
VYVADSKLAQFAPPHRRWWDSLRLRKISGSIGTSGTQIGFESDPTIRIPAPAIPKEVMRYVEEQAHWWSEDRVRPGHWIFFDAAIYTLELDPESEGRGAVIFFDIVSPGVQVGRGRRRLLLHGGVEHLVEGQPLPTTTELPFTPNYTTGLSASRWATVTHAIDSMGQAKRSFRDAIDETDNLSIVRSALSWLINEIADDAYSARLATWMAGCAQVTAVVDVPNEFDVVVGSPLYLERVPPPGEEI